MKILGVIPSRYGSGRFPGKPLAIISGHPMIWWVHKRVSESLGLDDIIVATDDLRIADVCSKYGIKSIMTSSEHPNCFHRVHEVSCKLPNYDKYLVVNGDEPLIESSQISKVIEIVKKIDPYYLFTYRKLTDPAETLDTGNMKVVVSNGKLLYISRLPVPCPHKTILFSYHKILGVQAFSSQALDFFVNTPPGEIEQIEDIAELRWLENHKIVDCVELQSDSISVDNPRDIAKVEKILKNRSC